MTYIDSIFYSVSNLKLNLLLFIYFKIRSQTGSGKTLAYALPIMNALLNIEPRLQRQDGVQVIIVVPTRELAIQTHELFGKINVSHIILILICIKIFSLVVSMVGH